MNKLLITAYVITALCITTLITITASEEFTWLLSTMGALLTLSAIVEYKSRK